LRSSHPIAPTPIKNKFEDFSLFKLSDPKQISNELSLDVIVYDSNICLNSSSFSSLCGYNSVESKQNIWLIGMNFYVIAFIASYATIPPKKAASGGNYTFTVNAKIYANLSNFGSFSFILELSLAVANTYSGN
jgi:hypothetical protein